MRIYGQPPNEWYEYEFADLKGKIIKDIVVSQDGSDDRITFFTEDGDEFLMNHCQDCCESVIIESIVGDLQDLIGNEILVAEERWSGDNPPDIEKLIGENERYQPESQTWTFYTLRTIKGSVDIRWHGASNGYYSESVGFSKI